MDRTPSRTSQFSRKSTKSKQSRVSDILSRTSDRKFMDSIRNSKDSRRKSSESKIKSTTSGQMSDVEKPRGSSSTSVMLMEQLLKRTPETGSITSFGRKQKTSEQQKYETEDDIKKILRHPQSLEKMPLFPTAISQPAATTDRRPSGKSIDTTFLITGFGLRNLESLQNALLEEERKRLRELYKAGSKDDATDSHDLSDTSLTQARTSMTSMTGVSEASGPATECSSGQAFPASEKRRLEYLMGLPPSGLEEYESEEKHHLEKVVIEEGMDELITGTSEAMRMAQKYLRSHHVFEFFQFLIAHMLSAIPDNPIEFLVDLLDKCLLYRSGLGKPPMLYNEPHLEQLFYLMDRMRTGFIDLEQYKTGMITLGICSYNPKPPLTADGMVSKEVFVTEATDRLIDLLNDMIRRRWIGVHPSTPLVPPPTRFGSTAHDYLIKVSAERGESTTKNSDCINQIQ